MSRSVGRRTANDCDILIRQGLACLPAGLLEAQLSALKASDLATAAKADKDHVLHTIVLVSDALHFAKYQAAIRAVLNARNAS